MIRLAAGERFVVGGSLALLIVAAWVLLVFYADGLHTAAMPMPGRSGLEVAVGSFVMWTLMMVAMMTPSAVPMILVHARVAARAEPVNAGHMSFAFAGSYVALWTAFALAATLLQDALARFERVDHMLSFSEARLGGAVLIAAGVYQWMPLKHACLAHCRGPVHFLSRHWHPGILGALRTGVAHGLYCIGCCWVLMLLLFVGGVMNFAWIAGLTALVMAEKMAPAGPVLSRIAGLAFLGWGATLLFVP